MDETTQPPTATPPAPKALVVEDEPNIRELVVLHLEREGLSTVEAGAGDEALRQCETTRFDLVVLDLMLPNVDGLTVCRQIRRQGPNTDVPILMLTARRDESDKVLGLDGGADDYLTKPFGVRELVARARALLRRPRVSQAARLAMANRLVTVGPMRLDPAKRQLSLDERIIELTRHEFDVLHLLASHPGLVFTREMLLEHVWTHDTHVTERSVDTLVKRLRQKIETDTREPRFIQTVWGTGYKLADGWD